MLHFLMIGLLCHAQPPLILFGPSATVMLEKCPDYVATVDVISGLQNGLHLAAAALDEQMTKRLNQWYCEHSWFACACS